MTARDMSVTVRVTGLRRFRLHMWALKVLVKLTPRQEWIDRAIWRVAMWSCRQLAQSAKVVR